MKKLGIGFLIVILNFMICTQPAYAQSTITIDGAFNDWSNLEHTNVSSGDSFYSKIVVTYDNGYIYIHAIERTAYIWEPYTYVRPQIEGTDGSKYSFTLTPGDSVGNSSRKIIVRNASYQEVSNASGMRTTSGSLGEWEVKIPFPSSGFVPAKVKLTLSYSSTVTLTIKSISQIMLQQETTNAVTETTTTAQTSTTQISTTNTGDMIIDGYFDDWNDKPYSYVTNWDMPDNQRNENNCRKLSMFGDGDNIYVHVTMRQPQSEGKSEEFNGNNYSLTANGKSVKFYFVTSEGKRLPGANLSDGIYDLYIWYSNGQNGLADNTPVNGSKAKLVVKDGQADECEFSLPLSIYTTLWGISVKDISQVSITNPSMFYGSVSTSSTSTYPIVGIVICGVIAFAAFGIAKKRRIEL